MTKFPNLQNTKTIALDLETKDPNLRKLGPGYYRAKYLGEDANILCVSIATKDKEWALPWNENTVKWMKDNLHLSIIGANTMYDLAWLMVSDSTQFKGDYHDILINESLINGQKIEKAWFSLDKCSEKYLAKGKQDQELWEYCDSMAWGGDPRQHIWKMFETEEGRKLVLKYAKADARQTFDIYEAQQAEIEKYKLERVVKAESRCLKPRLRMKKNGVKFDTEALPKTIDMLFTRMDNLQKEIDHIAGFSVNVAATASMKKAFDSIGLPYAMTAKGNPSFKKDYLLLMQHPFPQKCVEWKMLQKLQSTYASGFEKYIVNGRVYADFHQVKNGSRGTETGRFSASNPNLQNIPQKGEGKAIIRSLFLPEEGHLWEKQDQSQEEFRILAHFARGEGASALREFYQDPNADMHNFTKDFVKLKDRGDAKTLNFTCVYGCGVHKFAQQANLPVPPPWTFFNYGPDEKWDIYKQEKQHFIDNYRAGKLYFAYHERMPFIKITNKEAEKVCLKRGYAKTILGRRRYLTSSNAWTALNSTVQGSGGDIMKLWLADCEEAGVWDVLPLHLTVHDEAGFSVPPTKEGEEAAKEVQRIGEQCIELRVPLKVDREQGSNWANVKELVK